jgi:pimeloyl-ACP methyl ester carboxylesterase
MCSTNTGAVRNGTSSTNILRSTPVLDEDKHVLPFFKVRRDLSLLIAKYIGGIGHNLPQEAPEAFAKAVIDVDRF